MIAVEKTVKISSKGQITLPRRFREILQTDMVRIVVDQGVVKIEPVKDVSGALRGYSKGYIPLKKIKEKAWEEAVGEKHPRR
jgi:bifunctional DNA-binding transcriptional regulator/antitoxin component of YhaV-PrlF toxin-antitoxin module